MGECVVQKGSVHAGGLIDPVNVVEKSCVERGFRKFQDFREGLPRDVLPRTVLDTINVKI